MEQVKHVAKLLGIFWFSVAVSAATVWSLNKIFAVEGGEGSAVASFVFGVGISYVLSAILLDE